MPKHAGGRPTLYKESFVQKVYSYIETFEDHDDLVPYVESLPRILRESKNDHPFALSTIYKWAEEHPEFSEAIRALIDRQKRELLNKGLGNKINPSITLRALSATHDMREKTDEKHEHSGQIRLSSADKAIAEIDSALKQ